MTSPNDMVDAPILPISDQDIYQAMKEIPGYLDITLGDFKDLYNLVKTSLVYNIFVLEPIQLIVLFSIHHFQN